MTRVLKYVFAAVLLGLGGFVIYADVRYNHTVSLTPLVGGGAMLFVAGLIIDKADVLSAVQPITDALKSFFGRGTP